MVIFVTLESEVVLLEDGVTKNDSVSGVPEGTPSLHVFPGDHSRNWNNLSTFC